MTMYDQIIPVSNLHTFLGLTFDQRMNWNTHIAELNRKCLKSLNIIKLPSHVNWEPDRKIALQIYTVIAVSGQK